MTVQAFATSADDHSSRGIRRIVLLLVWLVIVPTTALLILGILMLVFWQARLNVLFGILVVTLVGCLVTGTVLMLVLLRREATLSKLQLDFVSKVSHELRTPLTSIRMFTEMLGRQAGADDRDAELCLQVLERETQRLSDLIERLLGWGRMEAGRRAYQMQPEDVEGLVGDAISALEAAVIGDRHRIAVEIEEGLPALVVDRGALVDAMVNLLSNAFKYTGDDKHISLRVESDGKNLRIEVRDNGIGIPRREQSRVFEKFYRADDRLSRQVQGSGLGLAIVNHVVQGHGGRVELESEPDVGSVFTIVLPLARCTAAETGSASPA